MLDVCRQKDHLLDRQVKKREIKGKNERADSQTLLV